MFKNNNELANLKKELDNLLETEMPNSKKVLELSIRIDHLINEQYQKGFHYSSKARNSIIAIVLTAFDLLLCYPV